MSRESVWLRRCTTVLCFRNSSNYHPADGKLNSSSVQKHFKTLSSKIIKPFLHFMFRSHRHSRDNELQNNKLACIFSMYFPNISHFISKHFLSKFVIIMNILYNRCLSKSKFSKQLSSVLRTNPKSLAKTPIFQNLKRTTKITLQH